ncbi:peptidase M23 [Streptomyces sp. NPDC046976]|uniref:peptidase M23 n=1 Tax=Streptomyces sp. NPDC046976 TaxID=3155258 RepID=UPI00340487D1
MEARDAARALGRLGGTALKAKIAAIAAVVFVIFLLFVGLLGAGGGHAAYADSCGDRGTPGVDYGDNGDIGDGRPNPAKDLQQQEIANAKIIDGVAADGGLSGRATLIALMTSLQESSLLNIDYGDRDSVGLFQQRPSAGWGTKEQIMKPKYAAHMFFFGGASGSPRGLTDIKGWETMGLGQAAQAVQQSAFPSLYDGQEDYARTIAKSAGIDLERAGKGGTPDDGANGDQDQDQTANPDGECYPQDGTPAKPGAPFHDGAASWPAVVKNPRSTADAIAWARNEAQNGGQDWYRACLAFVASAYGWNFSGTLYAVDHYKEMPASMRHDKDRNPSPGALMYWETSHRAGHVAIYLGDGKIASNDVLRPGYIDIVPATDIETKWGAKYLGWAPPYFPKGG